MTRTRGYIFDYGGTLDTGGCHWGKAFWHAYQRWNVNVSEQQFREAYVSVERTLGRNPVILPHFTFQQTLLTKVQLQFKALGLTPSSCPTADDVANDLYAATRRYTAHSRDVLLQIPEPKVLVSNFYGNISTVLHEFGLDGLFLKVVESAVVGVRKPDPSIFKLGVEALGLQPGEVTVVGDSLEKDIIPARKAGCRTVWLQGEQWTDDFVDSRTADLVIKELSELIK